jgi:hypothetical protein
MVHLATIFYLRANIFITNKKMRKLYKLFLMLFISSGIFAQGNRVVLLEHFTQASCGPCAVLNPQVAARLAANPNTLVAIKYQTSWPGVDPMNAHNPSEVAARVSYYGVTGVPHSVLDGNHYNGSVGGWNNNTVQSRANVPAKVNMLLSHEIIDTDTTNNDSIIVNVSFTATESLPAGHRLHVVVIEREINFPSPPGTNGEKDFTWVMKKMLPGSNGTILGAIDTGTTNSYTFKWKLANVYDISKLAVVAFVQNNTTKEVVGTSYSAPSLPLTLTLGMTGNGKTTKVLPENETKSFVFNFKQEQTGPTMPTMFKFNVVKGTGFPSAWNVTLKVNDEFVPINSEVDVPEGVDVPVEVIVTGSPGVSNTKGSLQLTVRPTSLLPSYTKSATINLVSPSDALIIDKYNSTQTILASPLTTLGVGNVRLTSAEFANFDPNELTQDNFKKIFLNAGDAFSNTMTEDDVNALTLFLENGGKLFVAGRDIAYEAYASNKAFMQLFLADYLAAYYISDGGTNSSIPVGKNNADTLVVPNLTFASGTLSPQNLARWSDRLELNVDATNAVPILFYRNNPDSVAAIINYEPVIDWKTFYAGFMLEAFGPGAATRATLYSAVNKWFDGVITSNQLKESIAMLQTSVFPNPASSKLHVKFAAGLKAKPIVELLDIQGRKMSYNLSSDLENEMTLQINHLKPGMYLLKMMDNAGNVQTHKFVKQ